MEKVYHYVSQRISSKRVVFTKRGHEPLGTGTLTEGAIALQQRQQQISQVKQDSQALRPIGYSFIVNGSETRTRDGQKSSLRLDFCPSRVLNIL